MLIYATTNDCEWLQIPNLHIFLTKKRSLWNALPYAWGANMTGLLPVDAVVMQTVMDFALYTLKM